MPTYNVPLEIWSGDGIMIRVGHRSNLVKGGGVVWRVVLVEGLNRMERMGVGVGLIWGVVFSVWTLELVE